LVQGELGGKVAMARADLLAQRNHDLALRILLAIQKSKSMPSKSRAEALLKTARLHASRQRHRDALPYFEQIYVLFNRYPDMVADAYFERGQSLEKLGMNEKAREVYSELANRPDLVSYQSAQLGIERAKSLGGVIAPHEPTGSIIPPKSASQ
jgi:tetratricopeptide (TPR) repeat protein